MKTRAIKSAIISALLVWTLGILAFTASYFFPVLADADLQANWVLSLALIPAATLGAHIYYGKGHRTNGFLLGAAMLVVVILMDAMVTVPFFIIPYGGSYTRFFLDPHFWLIAVELVSVVAAYWQIERAVRRTSARDIY